MNTKILLNFLALCILCYSSGFPKLPNALYDSIAIKIRMNYQKKQNLTGDKYSDVYADIKGIITEDSPIFWKSLINQNIIESKDADTIKRFMKCPCMEFRATVCFYSISDSAFLSISGCNILSGDLYYAGKTYEITFNKRIEKELKAYLKKLKNSFLPVECKECGY